MIEKKLFDYLPFDLRPPSCIKFDPQIAEPSIKEDRWFTCSRTPEGQSVKITEQKKTLPIGYGLIQEDELAIKSTLHFQI